MKSDWRECALGDVITLQRGFDLPADERKPGPVPIVSSSGVMAHHAVAKMRAPGVVTGRYGTVGQVFYIKEDYWPLNTALFVKDFKGNDPLFVSYLLRTVDFSSYSDKSSVPGVNRNHLHLARVSVPKPAEQQPIAWVLGALDDKIDLNRRMNETLEVLAQTLFQGMMEKGEDWREDSLDNIATYLNGLALQKFPSDGNESLPVIKISQLRAGNTEGADCASAKISAEYIVEDGDVLFSWSGSLEVVLWCGGRGALNQHLFKVTSANYPKWFYYLWTKHHLPEFQAIAAGKATTMGHIQRHHLSEAKVLIPPVDELKAMNAKMSPLIERIIANNVESRTLSALRDTLLPKLLSGAVRVNLHKDPR